MNLLKHQKSLQKQAGAILKELDLKNILGKHGEVQIVGSLALGLMVWEDIDIDVIVEKKVNIEEYFQTIRALFRHPHINDIRMIDNRTNHENDRPTSMYIGVHYKKEKQKKWKIDIRLVHAKDSYAVDFVNEIKSKLNQENTLKILTIKHAVHKDPGYGKKFSAVDIYKSVIEKNISNAQEFLRLFQAKQSWYV